ncbi:MAG TPA: family 16 glycoside hydrolase [Planctomycetota bacterium]|nr:family 16 glycoside hydrolase [Planctomycetota bacterium]
MLLAALWSLSSLAVCPQAPPIHALVVTGANNHEWQWTAPELVNVLAETGRFVATTTDEPATALVDAPRRFAAGELQVLVLDYNGPRWGEAAERGFLEAVQKGCGVAVVHAADNAFPGWTEYERLVGLLWRDGSAHGAYHPFDVYVVDAHHAITAGMADLRLHPDELYHRLVPGEGAEYRVLLSAYSDPKTGGTGRYEPMATAGRYGAGRVFHTPLGHVWKGVPATRATWADPQLRRLVARGSEWAATGAVTLAPEPLNWLSDAERADGFHLLFDGRSMAEWRGYRSETLPEGGWVVREAAIVHEAGGGGADLVSRDEYGEFDFRFSFRIAANGNSGVMWHVQEQAQETYMSGPEYQVLDDLGAKPDARHSVAALYDLVAPDAGAAGEKPVRAAGLWNDGRIVVQAGRVRFWLNGVQVVDAPCTGPEWDRLVQASKFRDWPFGKAERGRLALQNHGDEVAFRNLRVRAL